jgi:hypothetical protein
MSRSLVVLLCCRLLSCLANNPQSDPAAIVNLPEARARITLLSPSLLRVEQHDFEDGATFLILNRRLPVPAFNVSQTGSILTIRTSTLLVRVDTALAATVGIRDALRIDLFDSKEASRSSWWPFNATTGNLLGTFHTWDLMDGPQNGNCTSHDMWVMSAEPEWCSMGLVSRAGVVEVDDSLTPKLDTEKWPRPQTLGQCTSTGRGEGVGGNDRAPCFLVNNHRAREACENAGCCWDGDGTGTSHLENYWVDEAAAFYLFDPSHPQPNGTLPLMLWYSESQGDHAASTSRPDDEFDKKALLGYILVESDPTIPWCVPLTLWYSESLLDHVTTVTNCTGCGPSYVLTKTLGYVFNLYNRFAEGAHPHSQHCAALSV